MKRTETSSEGVAHIAFRIFFFGFFKMKIEYLVGLWVTCFKASIFCSEFIEHSSSSHHIRFHEQQVILFFFTC